MEGNGSCYRSSSDPGWSVLGLHRRRAAAGHLLRLPRRSTDDQHQRQRLRMAEILLLRSRPGKPKTCGAEKGNHPQVVGHGFPAGLRSSRITAWHSVS